MDRRGHPEVPIGADEHLREALSIITASYAGASPDRIYREAIRCFESLIEISTGADAISEFALHKGIDLKYLVDGANFVISKLHFNDENDYYLTLGLARTATQEEIHGRWKRLMLLYHPDRHGVNTDWVTERAKKVNEAYSVLKDEARRAAYDRKTAVEQSAHDIRHRSSFRTVHQAAGRTMRPHTRASAARGIFSDLRPGSARLRKYLPKLMIGLYLAIALTVITFIYIRNMPSSLESELAAAKDRHEVPQSPPADAVTTERTETFTGGSPRTVAPIISEQPVPAPGPPKRAAVKTSITEIRTKDQEPSPADSRTGAVPPSRREELPVLTGNILDLVRPVVPPQRERLAAAGTDNEAARRELPEKQIRTAESAGVPAASTIPDGIGSNQLAKSDVESFMNRYISIYNEGNLDAFMSLFASDAVENGTMRHAEIRSAYRDTFRAAINRYRLWGMDIRISGSTASVSGIYSVDQYLAREDRWIQHSGSISWTLRREADGLKIVSVRYDR